ncbi:MAG: DUF262 domain-containing protein [Chitinophagales bacterium]|nr:DUF262 domain-containing protein [Chitinophagales bacterium]
MEFISEQKVLNDLFGNDITYIIPQYQRPYSWDCIGKSDKNNQINVIWQDLIDFYTSKNPNIYFMGAMVMIGDSSNRIYEVIDGQQRLTTLTLLFTAIKCFLKEVLENKQLPQEAHQEFTTFINAASNYINQLVFNEKRNGLYTIPEKKVKIEKTVGFDYDSVLKTVLECEDASQISLQNTNEEQKEVTERYFKNRNYFIEQLKQTFLDKGVFTNEKAQELDKFFEFLRNKVTVMQIRVPGFEVAYQIFEILNNRGLSLSNKDLFRNFLIRKFHELKLTNPSKYADLLPTEKWRHLDEAYEFDAEFISRYVESKNGKNQKYSAYNDIEAIYNKNFKDSPTQSKIEAFYADIQSNLAIYTQIMEADFANKRMKNTVSFLLKAGNLSYTLNLLLTLFRQEKDEATALLFLQTFEKYILYMLLGNAKRFSAKPVYQTINLLNKGKTESARQVFVLSETETEELSTLFNAPIKDNDIAKIVLARYYYAIENQSQADVVEQQLDFSKATLEHIIPQSPEPATNWLRDFGDAFRKQYTYLLGNMTLLTHKMNAANKNYDFAKKKTIYAQTKLPLTNELAHLSQIDENFIKERHQKIVAGILGDLKG